jgi:glycogen(starch) synthase
MYSLSLAQALGRRHELVLLSGATNVELRDAAHVQLPHLRVFGPQEPTGRKAVWHLRDQWRPTVHRSIRRHLRRFEPQVIHTQEPQGLSAAVFTAVAAEGVPHVHTAHDLNLLCARVAMTRGGEFCGGRCPPCLLQRRIRASLIARRLDALIAPSEHIRRIHVDAGIVPDRLAFMVRQPADAGTGRRRAAGPDRPQLGFIGDLAPHKGLLTLLEAFRRAPDGWRLSIAGRGRLEPAVVAACARDSRISYVGFVSGTAKDRFFDALDVLVVPSECEENAPRTAVEAVVRGVPLVVSDRGGLVEMPEARTFPARDAAALLAAVHSLVGSEGPLEEISRRLLEMRERFLWPRHLEELERVYRFAVSTSRRERPRTGACAEDCLRLPKRPSSGP